MREWARRNVQRQSGYQPPPPMAAPPPGWRPAQVAYPAPPRDLPEQDFFAIDASEQSAHTVTIALGFATAAVLLVMLAVLCGQALR